MAEKKLIFRADHAGADLSMPSGYVFRIIDNLGQGLYVLPCLWRTYGAQRTLKTLAKVATVKRAYYAVLSGGRIASDGWIMFGYCKAYPISARDHVIGPIYTSPCARGKGLASAGLSRALRYCKDRGAEYVYIDTTENNVSSQKTIRKAGFSSA